MTSHKIKQRKDFIYSLENNFDNKLKNLSKDIITWVSLCVANFSALGVSDVIISDFIKFYKPHTDNHLRERIGNFVSDGSYNKFEEDSKSYIAEIAFLTAKNILKRMEEEERIVPLWLINEFSENGKFLSITSSLKLLETNYEDRDSDGIITNAISLLDEILNMDDELKKQGELGKKLNTLLNNPAKLQKFGVSKEYIYALNNSRLIRNIKSIHKTRPMKYDIPFLLAVNNAFLIVMFLEIALSAEIINIEKITT